MLSSIHPLGERARNQRWWLTAASYVVASSAAGALVGSIAGLVGSPTPLGWQPAIIIVVAGAAAFLELTRTSVPSLRRQVNEDWLHRYRGWVYGIGFGAQLGSGLATTVTTAGVYATIAVALVSGSARAGAGIGFAFGLSRAVMIYAAGWIRDGAALVAFHRTLQRFVGVARAAMVLAGLALASVATMQVLT